jgi:hypothetical protein
VDNIDKRTSLLSNTVVKSPKAQATEWKNLAAGCRANRMKKKMWYDEQINFGSASCNVQ